MHDITENRHLYDPEEQDVPTRKCKVCGDEVSVTEMVTLYDGSMICKECQGINVATVTQTNPALVHDFVEENKPDYLRYWWSGLDNQTRLKIIDRAYKTLDDDEARMARQIEADYAFESPIFEEFLRE